MNPVSGPATSRGKANRLENSAYWVAEKRFWVMRSSSTPNAPIPIPLVTFSKLIAPYIRGTFTSLWATRM